MSFKGTGYPYDRQSQQITPGPYGNKSPSQPMEEGRAIDNYTVGVKGILVCMENGTQITNNNFSSMAVDSQYHLRSP